MKTAIMALTKQGTEMAFKIGSVLGAHIYIKPEINLEDVRYSKNVKVQSLGCGLLEAVRTIFHDYEALVFIMACGIAVRAIAPMLVDKTTDPAVIVLDEKGQHVISLLSGHIGGANQLAEKIAELTGGVPVITTATDVNKVIAFDVLAKRNNCRIENIKNLKYISSELVNGGIVGLYTTCGTKGDIPENISEVESVESSMQENIVVISNRTDIKIGEKKVLFIRPGNLVLGIGCKRGTTKEQLENAVKDFMNKNKRSLLSVRCLATVDLKQDEIGLLDFCSDYGISLEIIQREDIIRIEKDFEGSEFVKRKVGVAGVAEPCSMLAAKNAVQVCKKTIYEGITLALAEEGFEFQL